MDRSNASGCLPLADRLGFFPRLKIRTFLFRQRLLEAIKYDLRPLLLPLTLLLYIDARLARARSRYDQYGSRLSSLFRSGWAGSAWLVGRECRQLFARPQAVGQALIAATVEAVRPLPNTRKFFEHPEELFEGVVIVLRPSEDRTKGVLLIKYSYYFSLMFRLFDVAALARRYHLVLEPSWAGYADPGILCYTGLDAPVFVMTYEARDRRFIEQLGSNLVAVDVGPSWWVDHRMFQPCAATEKRFDLIMVAAWDPFKRHHALFRAMRKLRRAGRPVRVALVGYSTRTTAERILQLADYFGVREDLSLFDKVPPARVAELFRQSRLNLLWSRFEGNNRAIIEGMFCDVPTIVRAGHNYGEHYFYINEDTGRFASEAELPTVIRTMLDDDAGLSPRRFVLKHMTYDIATARLETAIAAHDPTQAGHLSPKVNELDGMRYARPEDAARFTADYEHLAAARRV